MGLPNTLAMLVLLVPVGPQDRDTLVRNDREQYGAGDDWIYNDLERGLAEAKSADKPLMVVFRCIPCEACKQFDEDVARRDPVVREVMDRFVRVRIVQMNRVDLARFRFDFDQSFAIVFLSPDGTLLGRYGTRSSRPEAQDMALEGLRSAMGGALELDAAGDAVKAALAGKQAQPDDGIGSPEDMPLLAGRYPPLIDYEGATARSCLHCHQVAEGFRTTAREQDRLTDREIYPYPDPEVIGLTFDPRGRARVARVRPGSEADAAGIRAGDVIEQLDGQALISVADVQWVLDRAPTDATSLAAAVRREDQGLTVIIGLPEGWRRRGDLSWRASAWDMRKSALGGMRLERLLRAERRELGLPEDGMALRAGHVGEYDDHARAKEAGLQAGDVIVGVDGDHSDRTESDLLASGFRSKRPGESLRVEYLRGTGRHEATIRLP